MPNPLRRLVPDRRFAAALTVAAASALAPLPALALFGSDPGEEEPFLNSVEPGTWSPSIVDGRALEQDGEAPGQTKNRFLRDDETSVPSAQPDAKADAKADGSIGIVAGERASGYTDGLTAASMNSYGLAPAPAIEAYLEGIAARLLEHAPIGGVPYDIRLNGSQFMGDAVAYPEGVIVLPVGAVSEADSEDELAGLIAHELTHVMLNHHDAHWLSRTNEQLVSAVEIGAGMMLDLGQRMGWIKQDDTRKEMLIGYAASQATLFLSGTVLTPEWSRENELQADMSAIDLMIAADYSPYGYINFLNRVVDQESSMPDREERLAKLREEVDKRAAARVTEGLNSGDDGQIIMGVIDKLGFEIGQIFESWDDSHPETQERVELLFRYVDRHYAADPSVAINALPGGLLALRQKPEVRDLLANYHKAWRAKELGDGSPEAEQLALASISEPTKHHALPRLAFAGVRAAQGDETNKRRNLTYALEGPEPNLAVYQQAILHDLVVGETPSAFALISDAWERFKKPAALYPYQIHASVLLGDQQRATALNRECRLYFRAMARICAEAVAGQLATLLNPGPATGYVPPPEATGVPASGSGGTSGGTSGGAGNGITAVGDGAIPGGGAASGGDAGLFGDLLRNLPSGELEDDGSNQFEGGFGAGNDN
jgi:Zn-dependent protease with chaperone function